MSHVAASLGPDELSESKHRADRMITKSGRSRVSDSSAQPLVSVVITCYNQSRFLAQAINSVLTQIYPHFEIIVVDDGSTDDTPEVVARYPVVRYLCHANRGVSATRNRGFYESKGEHVIFLDGDDRLLPNAMQTGVNCLKEHSENAFVFGWCRLISDDGVPLPTLQPDVTHADKYLTLLRRNYIWMPALVMFQREAFERVGGFVVSADHSGDYDLYLRLARQFPIHCHHQTIAEWRQHEANTSRNFGLMLREALMVLRAQKHFVRGNKDYKAAYKLGIRHYQELYGDPLAENVRVCLRNRNYWRRAIEGVLILLRYYPQGLIKHAAGKLSATAQRVGARRKAG